MIIDTHAHLFSQGAEAEKIVSTMKDDGLEKIINIGTKPADSLKGVKFANKNADIFCTVGIHPEYASITTEEDLELIDKLASNKKVVAIGEIGLDYHFDSSNKAQQKQLFKEQIKIANKHNLPICIHTRDAKEDTYQILKENKDLLVLPSVMHCFSEDEEYAKKFLDLGFYISYSGNITYKKSDRSYQKRSVPLDRILVETDSPFLSPEPLRGTKNEPSRVKLVASKLASVYEMDEEEFIKHTVENAYRVFKKMR